MLEVFSGFDALGVGMLIGSALLLVAFVWVLVDNRSFDELNRHTVANDAADGAKGGSGQGTPGGPSPADRAGHDTEPRRPGSGRRVA